MNDQGWDDPERLLPQGDRRKPPFVQNGDLMAVWWGIFLFALDVMRVRTGTSSLLALSVLFRNLPCIAQDFLCHADISSVCQSLFGRCVPPLAIAAAILAGNLKILADHAWPDLSEAMADDGLAPLSTSPSLEGLDAEERIDAMVSWFFDNFEDPVHETPYNGQEGGYLYIHGGPYEAQDYIYDAFPNATEEERQEAVDQIDARGPEFAPNGMRILPPDEDDFDPEPPLGVRLEALAYQLNIISGHVQAMLAIQASPDNQLAGMGHNNPPKAIEQSPSLSEVLASVEEIERELAKPNRETTAHVEVLERAEGRLKSLLGWITDQVLSGPGAIIAGFMGAAGETLFEYVTQHSLQLQSVVTDAAHTLAAWGQAVSSAF